MAEAIWVIELDHLPLVVGIDAQNNDIFVSVGHAKPAFRREPEKPETYRDKKCKK